MLLIIIKFQKLLTIFSLLISYFNKHFNYLAKTCQKMVNVRLNSEFISFDLEENANLAPFKKLRKKYELVYLSEICMLEYLR